LSIGNGSDRTINAEGLQSLEPGEVYTSRPMQFSTVAKQPSFADMSSQQRSASMDATVRQVADLSRANNDLHARLVALEAASQAEYKRREWFDVTLGNLGLFSYHANTDTFHAPAIESHAARLDAIERLTATRWSLPFLARLRWLVFGV
jgi:Lon protease-like protein